MLTSDLKTSTKQLIIRTTSIYHVNLSAIQSSRLNAVTLMKYQNDHIVTFVTDLGFGRFVLHISNFKSRFGEGSITKKWGQNQHLMDFIQFVMLHKQSLFLDIGGGMGFYSYSACNFVSRVIYIDYDPNIAQDFLLGLISNKNLTRKNTYVLQNYVSDDNDNYRFEATISQNNYKTKLYPHKSGNVKGIFLDEIWPLLIENKKLIIRFDINNLYKTLIYGNYMFKICEVTLVIVEHTDRLSEKELENLIYYFESKDLYPFKTIYDMKFAFKEALLKLSVIYWKPIK